jgi:hypothetical protein
MSETARDSDVAWQLAPPSHRGGKLDGGEGKILVWR